MSRGYRAYTTAMEAVEAQAEFTHWKVLRLSNKSSTHVMAICRSCDREQEVDIHELRRGRRQCQSCANKSKPGSFHRLLPGESLLIGFEGEYKKSAVDRNLEFNLVRSAFRELVSANCTYCGCLPSQIRKSNWDSILVNGIDRVDRNIGYISTNCVSCCKTCNYMKRTMGKDEFLQHVERIFKHNEAISAEVWDYEVPERL